LVSTLRLVTESYSQTRSSFGAHFTAAPSANAAAGHTTATSNAATARSKASREANSKAGREANFRERSEKGRQFM